MKQIMRNCTDKNSVEEQLKIALNALRKLAEIGDWELGGREIATGAITRIKAISKKQNKSLPE